MASNVVSDNFETGTGGVPQLGGADRQTQWCKAWVRFNGTGTVAIKDSHNVSSVTDNGTGQYTLNFNNAMASTFYAMLGTGSNDNNNLAIEDGTVTTTSFRIEVRDIGSNATQDSANTSLLVFGD